MTNSLLETTLTLLSLELLYPIYFCGKVLFCISGLSSGRNPLGMPSLSTLCPFLSDPWLFFLLLHVVLLHVHYWHEEDWQSNCYNKAAWDQVFIFVTLGDYCAQVSYLSSENYNFITFSSQITESQYKATRVFQGISNHPVSLNAISFLIVHYVIIYYLSSLIRTLVI